VGSFSKIAVEPAGAAFRARAVFNKGIDTADAIERAVAALVGAGIHVRSVGAAQSSLEDVFAELTREEREDERSGDDESTDASGGSEGDSGEAA
jgi:hypothetical protein